MNAVFYTMVVAFSMENIWTSAQEYTVHGCKNRQVQLTCRTGLIQVSNIVLGDSRCYGSSCCPRQGDCRGPPSLAYRNQVQSSCNGQRSCSVPVENRDIGCGTFAPRNDYANVTFNCIAIPTSPVPSTSSRSPTTQFSTSFSHSSPLTTTWQRSTPSTSTTSNTPTSPDGNKETVVETEEGDKTSPSVKGSTELNPMHPKKPKEMTPDSEVKDPARQVQSDEGKDYGYLDRITTLTAVIVGGVVITVTVISVAIVLVLKKRRVVKPTAEIYDMPHYSCNGNNDAGNVRNDNLYDFIPDSGNCSTCESANVDCAAKENDYLTPVIESEEAPYLWIP